MRAAEIINNLAFLRGNVISSFFLKSSSSKPSETPINKPNPLICHWGKIMFKNFATQAIEKIKKKKQKAPETYKC